MSGQVWIPALEANQGTLTLAALVFAVLVALYEQYRANAAIRFARREPIFTAIELLEGLVSESTNLVALSSEAMANYKKAGYRFSDECAYAANALRIVADLQLPNAHFALLLSEGIAIVERFKERFVAVENDPHTDHYEAMDEFDTALSYLKRDFEKCLTDKKPRSAASVRSDRRRRTYDRYLGTLEARKRPLSGIWARPSS